ncbi:MAG: hypothetical protein SP1CHLAM54_02300 [Chlamydiia bacterium]|nr:hypothetical protein [Chlamydiia bacterium]MCH9615147.1 hypothetical protein [Chlamydiia bacterium]MCH9628531.1 hypothetical protein [Chlamydiia bacterium]
MAIYNLHEKDDLDEEIKAESKSSSFSSLAARIFFFLLLIADIVWGVYAVCLLILTTTLSLLSGFKIKRLQQKAFLRFKRSLVCAFALFVAIFSPALGVMFACTYFLMYDKDGIDEIVPSVLRDQFKEFTSN